MFGLRCQECHRGTVRETEVHDLQVKFENVPFVVPHAIVGVCDHCGTENWDMREYKRWRDLFRQSGNKPYEFMQPQDIRQLRQDLGMNIAQFAALLGATRQSVHHWEKDDRKVPQSRMVDNLLRLLRQGCDAGQVDVVAFLRETAAKWKVDLAPSPSTREAEPAETV